MAELIDPSTFLVALRDSRLMSVAIMAVVLGLDWVVLRVDPFFGLGCPE